MAKDKQFGAGMRKRDQTLNAEQTSTKEGVVVPVEAPTKHNVASKPQTKITPASKAARQANRVGKKTVIAYAEKTLHKQIRDVVYEEEITMQDAVIEALEDWLQKKQAQ